MADTPSATDNAVVFSCGPLVPEKRRGALLSIRLWTLRIPVRPVLSDTTFLAAQCFDRKVRFAQTMRSYSPVGPLVPEKRRGALISITLWTLGMPIRPALFVATFSAAQCFD